MTSRPGLYIIAFIGMCAALDAASDSKAAREIAKRTEHKVGQLAAIAQSSQTTSKFKRTPQRDNVGFYYLVDGEKAYITLGDRPIRDYLSDTNPNRQPRINVEQEPRNE